MDTFIEILKYTIPSLITGGIIYLVIHQFMQKENSKMMYERRVKNNEIIMPVRIQAYERLIILLERIAPGSLVMRVNKTNMSSRILQAELIKAIRAEYEHNLSQQIFVSNASWQLVKNAKEEMIRLVNTAAGRMNDSSTGLALSSMIFEMSSKIEKMPTDVAIEYLKNEIRQSF